jgi:CHAT domain-containing protein
MSMLTSRPTLSVNTTYLHESDRAEAAKLGSDLFHLLTRPIGDPLGCGAGIPVLSAVEPTAVTPDSAEIVVVIPVLGATAFYLQRRAILKQLKAWHKDLGAGHVLILPISSQWRTVESELPSKQLLSELYGDGNRRHRTLEEIVLALTRILQPAKDGSDGETSVGKQKNAQLFISHAKADLSYTNVAKVIYDYVVGNTTGSAFFDVTSLVPGESLAEQLDASAGQGVLLAIRGDAYSSRSWCQRELLTAKQHGVPTLVVEVLKDGEKRSSPYAGNVPTIVWNSVADPGHDAEEIVLRAMVECLRTNYFRREGDRVKQVTGLPIDSAVLARPPELLDLAYGRIKPQGVVLYPDPELSVAERQILHAAYPRLQMVTPTTAYRRLSGGGGGADAPLEGQQVAVSISGSPDVDGPAGFTAYHLVDAIVYLARTLISSGAAIAYGGDFRMGGYTEQLSELVASHNETASDSDTFLHLYQDATVDLAKEAPPGLKAEVHHLSNMREALVPFRKEQYHAKPLYLSDMRRVMAELTMARVIIGGKVTPKFYDSDSSGYSGIYPGVVEEAWRTLAAKKPLYALGGFGGAAAVVADLLAGKRIPSVLNSKTWKHSKVLFPLAETLQQDKYFKQLKLPASMEELAERICAFAKPLLKSDKTAKAWNGLTREENAALFQSRDPLLLATLVLKGLLEKHRTRAQGKLKVELVNGSVTRAERLNAIAVATFENIPLSGAGAALDRAGRGRASAAHAQGQAIVRLDAPGVDADWLYLASLGSLGKSTQAELIQRVRQAAEATREIAERHRFERLGVVTFGGAVVRDIGKTASAMLDSLRQLGEEFTVSWFETDKDQFARLRQVLGADPSVALTTKRIQADSARPPVRDESLIIQVALQRERLAVTTLPPSGTAIASSTAVRLPEAQVDAFSAGEGPGGRETPSSQTLETRGTALTKLLLGDQADQLLEKCQGKRIVVVHDVAASRLPFELMTMPTAKTPLATRFGLSRRLAVSGASVEQLFARMPKSGQLNLLLIANPTEDLPGTETEAKAVQEILRPCSDAIQVQLLAGPRATKQAICDGLAHADIVHYCGHAFYEGPGEESSGLLPAGRETLTLKEMRSLGILPRIAFFNACEAARVRGVTAGVAASTAFAEFFLRSGIEAYLGTYWRVSDAGAASFAKHVYSALANGATLDDAVQGAKAALQASHNNEWANYILYGNGAFRLLQRQSG